MTAPMTIREGVLTTMRGETPDRLPFVDRMNLWYHSKHYTNEVPERYQGMSLSELHTDVGMGELEFETPYGHRLRGVEMVGTFNGEKVIQETDPIVK